MKKNKLTFHIRLISTAIDFIIIPAWLLNNCNQTSECSLSSKKYSTLTNLLLFDVWFVVGAIWD